MTELTIRGARQQKSLLEWSRRVADCRGSGVSVSRWCEEHGINRKTYYFWQKKVFAAMIEQQELQIQVTAEPEKSRFVELPAPSERKDLVATVRIGRAALDVYSGASAELAAAHLRGLRGDTGAGRPGGPDGPAHGGGGHPQLRRAQE